jgi:hypothetical protein
VYAISRDAYLRNPAMPYAMIESGYEGDGASASQLRAEQYRPVLSGASGVAYGNRDVWPAGSKYGRSGHAWQNHLNDRMAFSAGHAARVMQSRAFPCGRTPLAGGHRARCCTTPRKAEMVAAVPQLSRGG